jgi:transposase
MGVSNGAVSQWLKRAREGGAASLYSQPPPGPTPRLTTEQPAQLRHLLSRGGEAFGFIGEVWTAKRVAAVIGEEVGVRYHPDYVGRLLRTAGWSPQKPIRFPSSAASRPLASYSFKYGIARYEGLTWCASSSTCYATSRASRW